MSATDTVAATFAADVERALSRVPRQIPSQYLYDRLGSALFEAICRLPWYRVTAAEQRLLGAHAAAIFEAVGDAFRIIELGPGSGDKLVTLALAGSERPETIHLIDVSVDALDAAARNIAARFDVPVMCHAQTYEAGLRSVQEDDGFGGAALVLFLGSNIGNFAPPEAGRLLAAIRATLKPGDALLLGADLVKPESELLAAYDDPLGVTAAFNRNLLVRINRELGADFDVAQFRHRAVWNAPASRVEMHLVSTRTQRVRVPSAGLDITFAAGETIWTESSYKFQPDAIRTMLEQAGFRCVNQWVEERFALTVAAAI